MSHLRMTSILNIMKQGAYYYVADYDYGYITRDHLDALVARGLVVRGLRGCDDLYGLSSIGRLVVGR